MKNKKNIFPLSRLPTEQEIKKEAEKHNISLAPGELRKIAGFLGRDPTLVECFVFDIEWSEHCSYKSSRAVLKKYLPTEAPNVILGVGEDAGIIHFTEINGTEYGLVISHESHNHPSQVLPGEGAGTGIGGIVRDVDCMGARVVGAADSLRFGESSGKEAAKLRWIASGVVDGIWEYANALGVPNLGGEVYYDSSYNDNCLVNIVAVGIVRKDRIIYSRAPEQAKNTPHDIILVGKPTDDSGFGGATFASDALREDNTESKGAVQVPDPFLKNVLLMRKANEAVCELAERKSMTIGIKDIGAGGIACATSELASAGGFGARIKLDLVNTTTEGLPPEVIACAETQERYVLAVPESLTPEVLKIYNEDWALPEIYEGAGASRIGKITNDEKYTLAYKGETVCDAPAAKLTGGISCERKIKKPEASFMEPLFDMPEDMNPVLLKILSSRNICSKTYVFRHYDTEVQGNAVLRPGEADAGVIAPLIDSGSPAAAALSVDGNPFYGKIDPYLGGANAAGEAMRNVAATGAAPACLTDCLNYGNPENPEDFYEFVQGVKGISDAAKNIHLKNHPGAPVPVVSGNVSFYNESHTGKSIAPSPIVACVGIMDDYSLALSMHFKSPGSIICSIGPRYDELGGSEYYRTHLDAAGKNVPEVRFKYERNAIYAVTDCISRKLFLSCHDISNGGYAVAAAEMLLPERREKNLGAAIDLDKIEGELRPDKKLFSESSGFIMEIPPGSLKQAEEIFKKHNITLSRAGEVTAGGVLSIKSGKREIIKLPAEEMLKAYNPREIKS